MCERAEDLLRGNFPSRRCDQVVTCSDKVTETLKSNWQLSRCPRCRSIVAAMHFNLKSLLRKVLHDALSLFSMSAPDFYPELPKTSTGIESYCAALESRYALASLEDSQPASAFRVLEVSLRKETSSLRHEYLFTKVSGPGGLSHVVFERRSGDRVKSDGISASKSDGNQPNPSGSVPTLPLTQGPPYKSKWGSSLSSLDSLTKDVQADDAVTAVPDSYQKGDIICSTLDFSESPIPLHQFSLMALVINQSKTKYLLFSDNCYFYAGTLFRMLQVVFPRHRRVDGMTKSSGRWGYISIFNENTPPDIDFLKTQFERSIESFDNTVRI